MGCGAFSLGESENRLVAKKESVIIACEWTDDHDTARRAVAKDGLALEWLPGEFKQSREIALAAVSQNGWALKYADHQFRSDREIVLGAVTHTGVALQWVDSELRCDREIVLAAVSHQGTALRFASKGLQADREVVSTAAARNQHALTWAADSLLEDETFAQEAKQQFYLLRVIATSGRSCMVLVPALHKQDKDTVAHWCCRKLGLQVRGTRADLLYGAELVAEHTPVELWVGSPKLGAVTEYQLVVMKAPIDLAPMPLRNSNE